MTRTDSQRTASRLNGSQSNGPTTPEGRLTSSRNSTKHGLTGDGKHLPPEMQAELLSEIALFSSKFHPRDPYEHDLIRRAALGNLRAHHISTTLNALSDHRVRNATRLWDEARADEVARLADKLPHAPATALARLRRLTEGCDYLADSWESLAQTLRDQGFLDDAQSLKVFHLLGHTEPPSLKDEANPLTDLWLTLLSLQFDHNPKPLLRSTLRHLSPPDIMRRPPESVRTHPEIVRTPTEIMRSHLPDPSTARTDLAQFLADQVTALETEAAHLWETYDLPARASAPTRAAFDTTPETILLERYLTASNRLRRQSLDELARLRRDAPYTPAPIEPHTPAPIEPQPPAPIEPQPPSAINLNPEIPAASNRPRPEPSSQPNEPSPTAVSPQLPNHQPLTPTAHAFLGLTLTPPTFTTVPISVSRLTSP